MRIKLHEFYVKIKTNKQNIAAQLQLLYKIKRKIKKKMDKTIFHLMLLMLNVFSRH